ncbi:hypothetical protein PF005_g16238 [Phytophthora fragariae]|uniref:poly(ADP-ribose) glycohydrolase n=1 Tax=Phytophthora fragariae TaxID=53985 RepID=A0A6A4D4S9_9STRA|nr:hypothetical protein PF003_g11970 [Phytophthora fragariae]KAE8936247.1 hypothetical protein PF009_g13820 [Phytophthora fragariae]KAE9009339.1 hypothetical protein PF011_g10312 [Phytophthora fragariae]KAE9136910.1 hypothetical protein PF006_g14290 [Phytophthora fragariae]KAE9139718.1 hypothetical protein PF007_g924 [Phytophthora fragariae]
MSRGFSLAGAVFAFHCVPPRERHELEALLLSHNGALHDASSGGKPDVVHVITSYWADCAPAADALLRPVTRFWLTETLRLGRWLRPDSHPFFEPPPRPAGLWLQYPRDYQDVTQDRNVDGDGDVRMETAAATTQRRVRLPCSPSFLFRDEVPLWPYIAAFLAQPMRDVHELSARLQLMTLSDPRRSFNCMEYAVNELLPREEKATFFSDVLPEMARLVLDMPQMFATPPPLLTPLEIGEELGANTDGDLRRKTRVLTQSHRFTKLEVLTLVCGCFFGIFPDQDIVKQVQPELSPSRKAGRRGNNNDDFIQFPYFTAVRMFSAPGNMGKMVVLKAQKLRCILQYFLRVVPRITSDRAALSAEVVDFTRVDVHLPVTEGRTRSEQTPLELLDIIGTASDIDEPARPRLYAAKCVSDTLIEDLDKHLQIDFANKFAGGGVLNSGCVQEEIRFLLSPELLVSCLIFAKLERHEAFVIHGTERYSAYQGYGGSFVYGGNYQDTIRLTAQADGRLRRECVIVGIDATDYGSARVERQYTRGHVWRDLVKAYAGFAYPDAHDGAQCWPVATGNWGCGVFQGDRELKFLIQWLAASLRHRDLVYVLFERNLDLQNKVNPLLTLATSPKARDWDGQSGGLAQWLAEFLFDELSVGRGTRGEQNVLSRAATSLERALSTLVLPVGRSSEAETKQQPENAPQAHTSPPAPESKQSPFVTPPRREDQVEAEPSEAMKKKPKTMKKDLQQRTMQDFFAPKK